jgi:hypothetical protein
MASVSSANRRLVVGLSVTALVLVLIVCWLFPGNHNQSGTVTGTVTFKGAALPGGVVILLDASDNRYQSRIQADGSYVIPDIAPGPARIVVDTTPGSARGNATYPYGPYVQIPRRYARPETSGFGLNVGRGTQKLDIDLNDDFDELPKNFDP